MTAYKPRIADNQLKKMLRRIGAVLIQGPKWCGKTTTAEQMAASCIYLDNPEKQKMYRQTAELNIGALLQGETPRLMDEWQLSQNFGMPFVMKWIIVKLRDSFF